MVGYRGYGKLVAAASERNARRGLHSGGVNARGYRNQRCIIPRISEVLGDHTPGPPGPGLAALFDSAETQEFLGEKRLSRSLSLVAIQAAKNKSQPKETEPFIAEALHRVVWLNRHEDGGEIDGHPAGRRAFKLLHAGFPLPAAATNQTSAPAPSFEKLFRLGLCIPNRNVESKNLEISHHIRDDSTSLSFTR